MAPGYFRAGPEELWQQPPHQRPLDAGDPTPVLRHLTKILGAQRAGRHLNPLPAFILEAQRAVFNHLLRVARAWPQRADDDFMAVVRKFKDDGGDLAARDVREAERVLRRFLRLDQEMRAYLAAQEQCQRAIAAPMAPAPAFAPGSFFAPGPYGPVLVPGPVQFAPIAGPAGPFPPMAPMAPGQHQVDPIRLDDDNDDMVEIDQARFHGQ